VDQRLGPVQAGSLWPGLATFFVIEVTRWRHNTHIVRQNDVTAIAFRGVSCQNLLAQGVSPLACGQNYQVASLTWLSTCRNSCADELFVLFKSLCHFLG
jgi:hypothetical protein